MPMNPIPRASATLVALLAAGLFACGGGGAGDQPRNVILISIDTLRPDFLGCYGYERPTSPALDRLAEAGTLFEDVTSGSPWTLPGHATMLTGLFPSRHGVKDHVNQLTDETLATRLRKEGFRTMAVVNSHNIGTPAFGLMRGFDKERSRYVFEMDPPTGGPILNMGREITDTALGWLRDLDDRRFFLFLHYYDVHTDFTPEARYKAQFVGPYEGKLHGRTPQLARLRDSGAVLTAADIRWLKEMYDAEIRQLDEILSGLFDFLEDSGLADETLVVITSDHGEEYYEHEGLLHGRTQYQELLAIPLFMRGPGVPEGLRIPDPVHQVDIAPTILSLLGVAPTTDVDGIDLTNNWRNPAALPEIRLLYGEADHNNIVDGEKVVDIYKMIRIEDDKLIYNTLTGEIELYDLSQDPGEQKDLSKLDPERAAVLMERLQFYMDNAKPGAGPLPAQTAEQEATLKALGY
jgi:arylsulfatase